MAIASDLRGPTSTSTASYDKWFLKYQKDLKDKPKNYDTNAEQNAAWKEGWNAANADVLLWTDRIKQVRANPSAAGWPIQYNKITGGALDTPPIGTKWYSLAQLEYNLTAAKKTRDAAWKKRVETAPATDESKRDKAITDKLTTPKVTTSPRTATVYNIPSVREAYHASSKSFLESFKDDGINSPAKVQQALDLWTAFAGSGNSKGMIQSLNFLPTDVAAQVVPKELGGGRALSGTHGFQFLYNPNRIDMTFNGVTGIDVAAAVQDSQNFNLLGTSDAPSTVSFSILINRMLDMKYVYSGGMKPGFKIEDVYGNNFKVSSMDLVNIYEKGTMYDVEFLLKTLTGFELPNAITGKMTSDIGFIGARPVELHLGPNLRYIVRIDSFSISHKAFSRRMTPIYTEIELTCGRLPWSYSKDLASKVGALSNNPLYVPSYAKVR